MALLRRSCVDMWSMPVRRGGGGVRLHPPFGCVFFFFFFCCLRACYRSWWCTKIPYPVSGKLTQIFETEKKKCLQFTNKWILSWLNSSSNKHTALLHKFHLYKLYLCGIKLCNIFLLDFPSFIQIFSKIIYQFY